MPKSHYISAFFSAQDIGNFWSKYDFSAWFRKILRVPLWLWNLLKRLSLPIPMRIRGFEIISAYQNAGIRLPERQSPHSAGYDIEAAEEVTIKPRSFKKVPTGLKAYMQPDEFLAIHIRSGLAFDNGLSLVNGVGVVDADYYNNCNNEGHIMVGIANPTESPFRIMKGQRIAQGIFQKYHLSDLDTAKGERKGGFGSTGM